MLKLINAARTRVMAVEYALSRAVSPAVVAEDQVRLPDKKLLQAKLHEFYEQAHAQAALPPVTAPIPKPAKPIPKRLLTPRLRSRPRK